MAYIAMALYSYGTYLQRVERFLKEHVIEHGTTIVLDNYRLRAVQTAEVSSVVQVVALYSYALI